MRRARRPRVDEPFGEALHRLVEINVRAAAAQQVDEVLAQRAVFVFFSHKGFFDFRFLIGKQVISRQLSVVSFCLSLITDD
jgi:hypothetical protein